MKVFYTTDLHGQSKKYKMVLRELDDHELLILGADILPKGGATIDDRERFINNFLPFLFDQISIPIIIDFGNDDLKMFYDQFMVMVNDFDHVHISNLKEVVIGDYSIIGMHYVPDYPFGLKDWCRSEKDFLIDPFQIHLPATTESGTYKIIPNLSKYYASLPTINEILTSLPKPSKDKVIYNMHAPPRNINLDVCMDYRKVGSRAVTSFLKNLNGISLHGHIHENYYKTNSYIGKVGKVLAIQPGQRGGFKNLVYCTFDLDDVEGTIHRVEL